MTEGTDLIAVERHRQVHMEGFTEAHDDVHHKRDELAIAAVCYAAPRSIFIVEFEAVTRPGGGGGVMEFRDPWPWGARTDKRLARPYPSNELRIHELAKSGALVAAEMDRILRVESQ